MWKQALHEVSSVQALLWKELQSQPWEFPGNRENQILLCLGSSSAVPSSQGLGNEINSQLSAYQYYLTEAISQQCPSAPREALTLRKGLQFSYVQQDKPKPLRRLEASCFASSSGKRAVIYLN